MTKKVLITGGSGFIGMYIAEKLISEGYNISILDINTPLKKEFVNLFINGDIFDEKLLDDLIIQYDAIIHLVGMADSNYAQKNPMRSFNLNVLSLQITLEAIRKSFKPVKLVFPSSAAVYGVTDDLPIKENSPLRPTNIYSSHKFICENLIQSYQQYFNIQYVILRFFNVYGKGNEGVIKIFLEQAKSGKKIQSFGPFQYRDFVYVKDVAEAVYKSIIYNKACNKIINVGSGKGTQIREIMDIACELFPEGEWEEVVTDMKLYDSIADITLARILLDFAPHDSKDFLKNIIVTEMLS